VRSFEKSLRNSEDFSPWGKVSCGPIVPSKEPQCPIAQTIGPHCSASLLARAMVFANSGV
jgi:hypothetical protein